MIIPEFFAQVNYVFTGGQVPTGAEITLGVENVAVLSASALATQALDCWNDGQIYSYQADGVTLTSVRVKLGPNDTGATAEIPCSVPGAVSGDQMAPNCAYLIKKYSDLGGRRGRGRMYVPGCDEGQVANDGSLDPTFQSNFQDNVNDFWTSLDENGIPAQLLHADSLDENGDPIPDTAPSPTPVTAFVVDRLIATQRRRLRR